MSEIDPLIKREMQWMALGVLENRDLAPVIIARVRRQKLRRILFSVVATIAISGLSISAYEFLNKPVSVAVMPDSGVTGSNSNNQPEIVALQSDYPVTWVLNLKNNTQDLISTAPSLGIFTSNTPLVSDSRPTTVLPGGTALLVYNFPEFKDSLPTSTRDTWQWNWYLAQLR